MKKDKKADFGRLPFDVDERVDDSLVTAHAGVPLIIELFRASGAATVADERVSLKSRKRDLIDICIYIAIALTKKGAIPTV